MYLSLSVYIHLCQTPSCRHVNQPSCRYYLYPPILSLHIYFEHLSCRHVYTSILSICFYIIYIHLYPPISIYIHLYHLCTSISSDSHQCVAVCCSVLQCVAVCCSVYHLYTSISNTRLVYLYVHLHLSISFYFNRYPSIPTHIHLYLSISIYIHPYRTPTLSTCIYIYIIHILLSNLYPSTHIHLYPPTSIYIHPYPSISIPIEHPSCRLFFDRHVDMYCYGVATISRLLKLIGLFCRIWSVL